jgi:hypothetical protein
MLIMSIHQCGFNHESSPISTNPLQAEEFVKISVNSWIKESNKDRQDEQDKRLMITKNPGGMTEVSVSDEAGGEVALHAVG